MVLEPANHVMTPRDSSHGSKHEDDDDDALSEAEIAAALEGGIDENWKALWDAVDALAEEDTFATWVASRTVVKEGDEKPVLVMPYPIYSKSVEEVLKRLGVLGLIVPYDWMNWDGVIRYREDPQLLGNAPVGDAVRILIAIKRAERFGDGNIEGALQSGLMQAALARLRRWYDADHRPN